MIGDYLPPTKEKLEELREQGIVPYSDFFTRSIVCLSALIATATWVPSLTSCFELLRDSPLDHLPPSGLQICVIQPLQSAPGLALVLALVALMVGLLQTRFLVHMGNVSVRGTRRRLGSGSVGNALWSLFQVALALWLGTLSLAVVAHEISMILLQNTAHYFDSLVEALHGVIIIWVALLALAGVGGWFIARRRFMLKHRMTADEIRASRSDSTL